MENLLYFCLCLLMCKERTVSVKERSKTYTVSSFQGRGIDASQVLLWGVFNHGFGVAPRLFFFFP